MKLIIAAAVCASLFLSNSTVSAQLSYDETIDGDLSGAFASPDALVFGVGNNTIAGMTGSNSSGGATNGTDADYFWFSLGAGQAIDIISTTRSGPGSQSFVGYTAGTSFTGQTGGDIDGNTLFSDGENITSALTLLSAGDHAFWIQETGGAADYSISFNVVSSVPEPSSTIVLAGLAAISLIRRRC